MPLQTMFPLAIFAIALVVYASLQLKWRRQCRAGAAKIYRELNELFYTEPRYKVLTPTELPPVELSGYQQVGDALVAAGFRRLGAFENLTVSKVYPHNRTFTEAYVGADDVTRAVTFRIQALQVVNVMATTTDGTLVVTSNAPAPKLTPPPGVDTIMLPPGSPVGEVLTGHARHVNAYTSAHPSTQWVPCPDLDEIIDADRRHARKVADYRRRVGLVTEAEMLAMAGGPDKEPTARRVWMEFCRIRDGRGRR